MPNRNYDVGDNPFDMRRFGNMFAPRDESPWPGLAQRNLFSQPGPQIPQRQQQQPVDEPEDPLTMALGRLSGRGQGGATSAYREHIGKMPTSEAHAPSKMRRLGGALAAAAAGLKDPARGLAIGRQITDAPYQNAIESWQMKGAGLKEQADIESQDVKSQIEYIKRIQEQQKEQRTEQRDVTRLGIEQQNANSLERQRIAQIDNYKNQNWDETTNAAGETVMVHPDGRTRNLGPSMAGREQANRERGTDIQGYNAATQRGQLGVSQGNLGMRGAEFGQRQAQDLINNAFNERRVSTGERGAATGERRADIYGQTAGFIPAGEQFTATHMAAQQLAATDPKWAGWSLDEAGMPRAPGDWAGTNTPDNTAREFMRAVETAKQGIISTRRPGVGNVAPPNLGGMGGGGLNFNSPAARPTGSLNFNQLKP